MKIIFILSIIAVILGVTIRKKYKFHEATVWSNILLMIGVLMFTISGMELLL